ncbi:O-antigen ligase family protein, partial [Armatimonas sp.]|uniref:O-antigen ligase family protein n=1 Tax=Armatimonas sp. TaxID=1872638 RepID=UPI00286ACA6B
PIPPLSCESEGSNVVKRRRYEPVYQPTNVLGLRETEKRQRLQQTFLGIFAGLLSLMAGVSYVLVEPTTLLVPILLLTATLLPAVLWYFPRLALYGIFGSAILFEIFQQIKSGEGLTDAVPFFWNINTMFENYLGTNPKVAPINFFELVLIIFSGVTLLRFATRQQVHVRCGSLFWPILGYLGFVAVGWFNGMATGGNFNEALQEIRAQFYFGVAYFLSVNAIKTRKDIDKLIWITFICITLKVFNYIYRHMIIFHGEIQDGGVGSHEEAFFFVSFIILLSVLSISRVQQKLQILMWALLPFVLYANITTNRRTAYAAMVIAMPVLFLSAYKGFPSARKNIIRVLMAIIVLFPPYFIAFRDSSGALGGPARAINSAISPNERDSSSDIYRQSENYDLMFTMRSSPVSAAIGYGYGKRFLTPASLDAIKDIYIWYTLLPHNQILWVWMRIGTLGFLVFWGMICAIIVYACRIIRFQDQKTGGDGDTYPRFVALYTLILVSLLLVFGLLDLQLSNFRNMIFVAIWIGAMVGIAPNAMTLNDPKKRRYRPRVGGQEPTRHRPAASHLPSRSAR